MSHFPALLSALVLATALVADTSDPSPTQVDEIVKKFAANETAFQRARDNYTYRQSAKVTEMDESGRQGGVFEVVADIVYPEGKRTERVVRAPVSTLSKILLTPEDEQDLRSVQPFVLNSGEIDKYFVRYLGREKLDEIDCYAFAVKPKKMEAGQRYFSGIIWVDDRDLMIVKSYGRGTGVKKKGTDSQYPKFETFREQIDGKYWFPTFTIANSVLPFETGPQRIRMTVRYDDYKQFKAETKITFGDAVESKEKKPEPKPKQ